MIKGMAYPTFMTQVNGPEQIFYTDEEGWETTEIATSRISWKKTEDLLSRVCLKIRRAGRKCLFWKAKNTPIPFLITNTDLSPEEAVDFYQKRGNSENYIKEAKYDMVVGQLLLKSFWSNEAIFQLMMLACNLFLLIKIDRVKVMEYRQQIKAFCLKYIFLAGNIVRRAGRVVMKLSQRSSFREIYEHCPAG